jgi:hypothetical protein
MGVFSKGIPDSNFLPDSNNSAYLADYYKAPTLPALCALLV